MIKKLIRSTLKRFGIIAFKRSSQSYLSEDEAYQIISKLVGRADPIVIDGGAHLGDMPERLGALLPNAKFHCFEPDPKLKEVLTQKFADNPQINVVQAALGDIVGKATFNINVSRPTNSLLSPSKSLQEDIKQLCKLVEQVEVEITTIDEYCQVNSIERLDIIKLDLQGYDYLALLGAKSTLSNVTVVLVEILFDKIYQGCGSFQEILSLMQKFDFNLHTLCGLQYGDDSRLLWADAIFTKND